MRSISRLLGWTSGEWVGRGICHSWGSDRNF